jgi:hypothetical protein
MRQVQSAAHGYPDRAYAKWLVLHFVWEKIAQHIESGNGERRFRYACERSTKAKETRDVLSPLQKALVGTFRAALAFHRSEVGRGEEAKDVSSFFRLTKLDQKLKKFWHSDANSQRKKVEGSLRKFVSALTSVESGTVG